MIDQVNEDTFDNESEEQEVHKGFEEDSITKSLRETQEKQLARREESEENDALEVQNDAEVINKDDGDEVVGDEAKADEPKEASETPTDDYPATWKGDLKDKWEALDPSIKTEILRREDDMHKGFEQVKSFTAYAQDVAKTFEPYNAEIKAAGSNQKEVLQAALNSMYIFRTGSQQEKANELLALANAYGVQMEDLNTTSEQMLAGMPLIDPEVEQLKAQFGQMQAHLQQGKQEQQQAELESMATDIDKFADDPKNKYFADVRLEMSRIFGSSQDYENLSLQEAYDNAVWANPVTREKLIEERRDTERREAADKAADAKKTAKTNVASRGQPLNSVKANGTLDDVLAETLSDIRSRR